LVDDDPDRDGFHPAHGGNDHADVPTGARNPVPRSFAGTASCPRAFPQGTACPVMSALWKQAVWDSLFRQIMGLCLSRMLPIALC
jgi:hypothetical protein